MRTARGASRPRGRAVALAVVSAGCAAAAVWFAWPTGAPALNAGVIPPVGTGAGAVPAHAGAPRPNGFGGTAQLGGGTATVTGVAIPAIDVHATVVPEGVTSSGALGIPSDIAMVGWWTGGARPGATAGTVVLAGHVDGRNAAGVPVEGALFYLDRTPLGSTVSVTSTVTGPTGASTTATTTATTTYRVVAKRQVTKTVFPRLASSIFTTAGAPRLVLVTCGGPFDQETRQYLDNEVLWAVPVSS